MKRNHHMSHAKSSIFSRVLLLSSVLICLTKPPTAFAQEQPQFALDEYLNTAAAIEHRRVAELQCSPDGRLAVAVLHTREPHYMDYFVDIRSRILVLIDLSARTMTALTEDTEDAHHATFSPYGSRVAFFSHQSGVSRVEVVDVRSKRRERIAQITGQARNTLGDEPQILWSNDGDYLTYAVRPGISGQQRFIQRFATAPANLREPVVIADRTPPALWQAQGMTGAMFADEAKEVWVVGVRQRKPRRILPSAHPSTELLSLQANETAGELRIKAGRDLSAVHFTDNSVTPPASLLQLPENVRTFRKLSAGEFICVTESQDGMWQSQLLQPKDDGAYVIVKLSEGRKAEDLAIRTVSADGRFLTGRRRKGTSTHLISYELSRGREQVIFGDGYIARSVVADVPTDMEVLAVATTATEPEMLFRVDAKQGTRQAVGRWPGVPAGIRTGKVNIVRWKSDGVDIEGILVLPDDGRRGAPYPTLLYLHGGPEDANWQDLYRLLSGSAESAAHVFANAGYAVLMPNFRGSTGYGLSFGKDLGNGRLFATPAKDSLAGLSRLVEDGVADARRLGIYGSSYGGMLTAWIIGRDHRFKAAVSAVGGFDLLANDRTLLGHRAWHASNPERAGPEDDLLDHWKAPEKYRELSPIETAFRVRTPTLLVSTAAEQLAAGDNYPQFFNALQINNVPSTWVYYPTAWHAGGWSARDRRDYIRRTMEWFNKWLVSRSNEN